MGSAVSGSYVALSSSTRLRPPTEPSDAGVITGRAVMADLRNQCTTVAGGPHGNSAVSTVDSVNIV